jgi:CRP-like cAMP-binding protein
MLHETTSTESLMARGQVTILGQRRVWQLQRGLLMVQSLSRPGEAVRHLALPGDWLNLECLCDLPADTRITALMPSQLRPLAQPPLSDGHALIRHLLLQQRRWTDDMLALRTGSVEQRLGRWLELLSRAGGAAASSDEVPTLREIATLVDAAPETVCRVLARLRAPDPGPARTKVRSARWAAPLPLAAF